MRRTEIEDAGSEPVELERDGARGDPPRRPVCREPPAKVVVEVATEDGQLALFDEAGDGVLPPMVPALPPLAEVPAPPLHRVRRLSFSALALFDRCSYRYYAERIVGMRPTDEHRAALPGAARALPRRRSVTPSTGCSSSWTSTQPLAAGRSRRARARLVPDVSTDEELERIDGFVRSYCESELARRVAALPGAQPERPFAFEHDGVLLHGRLDVLQLDGRARGRHRLQDELARRGDTRGDRRERLPPAASRLRARLLPRGRAGGGGRLPLPRASRMRSSRPCSASTSSPGSRPS